MVNKDMPTGAIEVVAKKIVVLNKAETLPFMIDEKSNASEDLRLRHREVVRRIRGLVLLSPPDVVMERVPEALDSPARAWPAELLRARTPAVRTRGERRRWI